MTKYNSHISILHIKVYLINHAQIVDHQHSLLAMHPCPMQEATSTINSIKGSTKNYEKMICNILIIKNAEQISGSRSTNIDYDIMREKLAIQDYC